MAFYFVATAVTSFFSFLTYQLAGNTLTAEKVLPALLCIFYFSHESNGQVFGSMSLFAAIRLSATMFLPGLSTFLLLSSTLVY